MKRLTQVASLSGLILVLLLSSSCRTSGKAFLYSESSIPPGEVKIRTVAILPNRLPVTLQDPEKWRRKNYEIISDILERKGCRVIPYETSNSMFQQSGLPLEDTKSSRDKYAELAQNLNADILVFPYYSTSFNGNAFSNQYTSIGSLQMYSLAHNDFSTRIDLEGVTKIAQWPNIVLPLGGALLGFINPVLGIVGGLGGPIYQVLTIGPAKKAYDKSFNRGLREGFKTYFARYPDAHSGGNDYEETTASGRSSGGKYSKFSIEELQTLKKAAVTNNDFEKAAEIKEEIDRRQ